jgi:nucleotide-binding universal stress UspA family protein
MSDVRPLKLLVPVDGSANSLRAVDYAIAWIRDRRTPAELHLLNVRRNITYGEVKKFASPDAISDFYQQEGLGALEGARERLDQAGIPYGHHVRVATHVAEGIADYAAEHGFDHIVMGSRGLGTIAGLLLGSKATKVLYLVDMPVTLVK